MNIKSVLLLGAAAVILYLFIGICSTKKEGYGGPVKNSRKIPATDCYKLCGVWYDNCVTDRIGDAGGCAIQAQACNNECYYSNFQRF